MLIASEHKSKQQQMQNTLPLGQPVYILYTNKEDIYT